MNLSAGNLLVQSNFFVILRHLSFVWHNTNDLLFMLCTYWFHNISLPSWPLTTDKIVHCSCFDLNTSSINLPLWCYAPSGISPRGWSWKKCLQLSLLWHSMSPHSLPCLPTFKNAICYSVRGIILFLLIEIWKKVKLLRNYLSVIQTITFVFHGELFYFDISVTCARVPSSYLL